MTRYVLSRLGSGVVTLLLFLTLLFFLINIVVPGDYVSQFILTAEQAEAIRDQLGLNRPLYVQYLDWIRSLATLNLGTSLTGAPVGEMIWAALPATLLILVVGLSVAFVLGGWLGRFSGYQESSLLSGGLTFLAVLFLTAFPPALAFVMEELLRRDLGFFHLGAFGSIDEDLWLGGELTPAGVMWRMLGVLAVSLLILWMIDRVLGRMWRGRGRRLLFYLAMVLIPLVVWRWMGLADHIYDLAATMSLLLAGVILLTFGDVLLVTRAAMDDVLLEDYIMVARAKGLPEHRVRDRHAARAALLPVLSRFTVSIPYFLTGLVILEAVFGGVGAGSGFVGLTRQIFGPPGMGVLIFDAVRTQDTPLIVGALVVVGAITLLLRIGLDVAHAAFDPRIRFDVDGEGG